MLIQFPFNGFILNIFSEFPYFSPILTRIRVGDMCLLFHGNPFNYARVLTNCVHTGSTFLPLCAAYAPKKKKRRALSRQWLERLDRTTVSQNRLASLRTEKTGLEFIIHCLY